MTVLVGSPTTNVAPAELGKYLFASKGCAVCHSVDGTKSTGPTLKGVFGKPVLLASGESVVADEAYVRESILQPNAKVVLGFPPIQPPYELPEVEIAGLVAYVESLQ